MSRTVCIDSQIFVWGVKRDSSQGQEGKIKQAASLLSDLEKKETKILLPVPVITELLSHIKDDSKREAILELMNNRNIIVKPFDKISALKCAELLQKTFTEDDIKEYTKDHKIPKAKIKYDAMITAIAIVNKCDCIYSTDSDVSRYSHGQIRVESLPSTVHQPDLFHEET